MKQSLWCTECIICWNEKYLDVMLQGGIYFFQIMDWYSSTFSLMILSLTECFVISWIYGIICNYFYQYYSCLLLLLLLASTHETAGWFSSIYHNFYCAAWNADVVLRWDFCLFVCPSVKRVDCDKTEEKSVQIFIPCERPFCLVLWGEKWLVGGNPFYLKFWVNRPALERNLRFWTNNRS